MHLIPEKYSPFLQGVIIQFPEISSTYPKLHAHLLSNDLFYPLQDKHEVFSQEQVAHFLSQLKHSIYPSTS